MVYEGEGGFVGEIEESYAGALQGEVLDGGGADALAASSDEDDFVGKAGVDSEDAWWVHRVELIVTVNEGIRGRAVLPPTGRFSLTSLL